MAIQPTDFHEEMCPLHAVLGNHLINTNRHGLKFDYVMGNGMHEWTQVLIWPLYWLDKTWVKSGL